MKPEITNRPCPWNGAVAKVLAPGHGFNSERSQRAGYTITEETVAIASAIYWSWWRARDMRGELKKTGWKHVAEGGKDFCPKCKPRRKPRRRSRTTVVLVNNERKTERG